MGELAAVLQPWRTPLLLIAMLIAAAGLWARHADLTLAGAPGYLPPALWVLAMGAIWVAWSRGPGVPRWQAHPWSLIAGAGLVNLGIYALTAFVILTYSYLFARLALPLQDAGLAALDARLGFDWRVWHAAVAARPALDSGFHAVYATLTPQLVATCLLMPFSGDRGRSREFFWLLLGVGMISVAVSGLLPAEGARQWFGVPGSSWLADVRALRLPGPAAFEFAHLNGIVTFPSFHTAAGVLLAWANRRTGVIGIGFALLNAVMIGSTLTEGGHYLVDVLGGAALAGTAIALGVWLRR